MNAQIVSAIKTVGWKHLETVSQCAIQTGGTTLGKKGRSSVPMSAKQYCYRRHWCWQHLGCCYLSASDSTEPPRPFCSGHQSPRPNYCWPHYPQL